MTRPLATSANISSQQGQPPRDPGPLTALASGRADERTETSRAALSQHRELGPEYPIWTVTARLVATSGAAHNHKIPRVGPDEA
jgi:hypothetical protein